MTRESRQHARQQLLAAQLRLEHRMLEHFGPDMPLPAHHDVANLVAADAEADPITRLEQLRFELDRVLLDMREAVVDARDAGETWTSIGFTLGLTRQNAREKYH